MKLWALMVLCLLSSSCFAGEWLPESDIQQIEARDGTWVSVVLKNTNGICPSNRVQFKAEKWINQEAVNQYFSMLLMATASSKSITVHVEIDEGICFGRIAYVKGE